MTTENTERVDIDEEELKVSDPFAYSMLQMARGYRDATTHMFNVTVEMMQILTDMNRFIVSIAEKENENVHQEASVHDN